MVQTKKQGKHMYACADPGIFTKWGGGGGVQAHMTVKSSDSVVLLFLLFFSPHLQLI